MCIYPKVFLKYFSSNIHVVETSIVIMIVLMLYILLKKNIQKHTTYNYSFIIIFNMMLLSMQMHIGNIWTLISIGSGIVLAVMLYKPFISIVTKEEIEQGKDITYKSESDILPIWKLVLFMCVPTIVIIILQLLI